MTLDEFETIRIIDHQSKTQEQCAADMNVARTTVTAIYDSARKKLAAALVEGKRIVISGGNYILDNKISEKIAQKGSMIMRIAVTYENGQIFQHFGRTEQFKLYDIADGKIINEQVVGTNGAGHGALAGFLKSAGVDVLICGGIGGGAQMAMQEAGITLYGGNTGSADEAVKAFLTNTLAQNSNPTCDHHHEHGEDHSCGHHACGEH
jgi:predicted Fe-Mo cluster-binding NifX family protein